MRNKKLLFILIPVIIIVLVLIGGFAYLTLNSTPEKIFTKSISKVFGALKDEEETTTLKGKMTLSANIESEEEEIQAINDVLETSSITLDMAVDTKNMIVNENFNVIYDENSLLNAYILLQDQKGYAYLPDWLDKYLEIPVETEDSVQDLKLDPNKMLEALETELINVISKQEFTQSKNGSTKISTLDLSQEQFIALCKEFLENLKQNEIFNNALGEYKEDVISGIDEMLAELEDETYDEESRAIISIYTKGLLNKLVGFSADFKDGEDTVVGMFLTIGEVKSEFAMYEEYNGERTEQLKVTVEDKKENKNKGTGTITVTSDEEEFVVVYSYENKDNQTAFEATTEIEGVQLTMEGNSIKDGNNYKGKLVISMSQEEYGTININCDYDFTYGVEIQKTDVQDAVLIDELSEEDQEKFMTNLQNSKLYELIEQSSLLNNIKNVGNLNSDEPIIKYNGKTVTYNVPTTFIASNYNTEDYKMYTDENYNSIYVFVENTDMDTYLDNLDEEFILTSNLYQNQEISESSDYDVNGRTYKFRTITYNDDYSAYVNLYFVCKLEDNYSYIVKVESENGAISLDDINMFLDINV